jgi:hypothetical protein
MLFREIIAVYCENRTEHINTLCGQNVEFYYFEVRTSQETHSVSITTPNRLMLFGVIIAVCCENHTEHTNTLCGQNAEYLLRKQEVLRRTNRLISFDTSQQRKRCLRQYFVAAEISLRFVT